jgi:hypothetical protein
MVSGKSTEDYWSTYVSAKLRESELEEETGTQYLSHADVFDSIILGLQQRVENAL